MTLFKGTALTLMIITSGLSAGLLCAFAYSVMPALNRTKPDASVVVMQRVNTVILNPVFAVIFFGGALFGAVSSVLWRNDELRWWVLAGFVLVLAGIVVTMAINVPANGRLAAAGDVTDADATRVWADFVGVWVRWNIIRAVLTTAGFALPVVGLVVTRP